jgi:hypothetical protein
VVNDITGYASTFPKIGSAIVFSANDEAFEHFYSERFMERSSLWRHRDILIKGVLVR